MSKLLAAQDYVAEGLNLMEQKKRGNKGGTKEAKGSKEREGLAFQIHNPTTTHIHSFTCTHICTSANTHMSLTLMYHMHTYTHAFMCAGHFSPGLQEMCHVERRGHQELLGHRAQD